MKFKFIVLLNVFLCLSIFPVSAKKLVQSLDMEAVSFLNTINDSTDRVLGKSDAPVTVVVYASFSCPHCAVFHEQNFEFLENHAKSGKLRFIFRHHHMDSNSLFAARIAHCVPKSSFFVFAKALYSSQRNWGILGSNYIAVLRSIVSFYGMSQGVFTECIENNTIKNQLINSKELASARLGIAGTPSIYVNDKLYLGSREPGEFKSYINSLL